MYDEISNMKYQIIYMTPEYLIKNKFLIEQLS